MKRWHCLLLFLELSKGGGKTPLFSTFHCSKTRVTGVKRPKETNLYINGGTKHSIRSISFLYQYLNSLNHFSLITSQGFHMNASLKQTYKNNLSFFYAADVDTLRKLDQLINFIHLQLFVLHYMKQMCLLSKSQYIKLFSQWQTESKCAKAIF